MIKKILSPTLILLTLTFFLKSEALAQTTPKFGEDITVGKNEVIEGPYLKAGDNITINGTIDGDAYLAGSFVTIDGIVRGDLIVGGGVVTIKGEVANDVRAGGGMVTIDGKVGGNITALGGTVVFGSDADVDGSVVIGGGTFAHMGNIDGRALIYSGEATLAGRVGKDVSTTAEKVTVAKTAILDGNLSYTSGKEASVSAEARVAGGVERIPTGKQLTQIVPRARGVLFRFKLLSYLSTLLLGFVVLKIAPRQVMAASKLIGEQPWRSIGLGLLALVLAPIAVVILMISVIGVPLAAILGGIYVLMIGLSSIFSGLFVGQKIFNLANLKENRYAMMALGLLVLQFVFTVPGVGLLTRTLSVLAATGAMLTLEREALRRLGVRAK